MVMNVSSVTSSPSAAQSVSPAQQSGNISTQDSAVASAGETGGAMNSAPSNISQMSTQTFVSLQNGCQQPQGAGGVGAMGGPQEAGMDLKSLVEMMMMMMMLKMMQDMMQQMGSSGA